MFAITIGLFVAIFFGVCISIGDMLSDYQTKTEFPELDWFPKPFHVEIPEAEVIIEETAEWYPTEETAELLLPKKVFTWPVLNWGAIEEFAKPLIEGFEPGLEPMPMFEETKNLIKTREDILYGRSKMTWEEMMAKTIK